MGEEEVHGGRAIWQDSRHRRAWKDRDRGSETRIELRDEAAGRPYPNAVDNIAVSRKKK